MRNYNKNGVIKMNDKRFTRIICSNDEYTGSLYCYDEPLKIETVCDMLNELTEENEHIKNTIQDMIQTERTEIGKSILKQLWSRIQ